MSLRNYWYVAAMNHEVGRKPFGRIILGEPEVFFRTEDGAPSRWRIAVRTAACRCRWASSSRATCCNAISRPAFDRSGRCVRVPGQDMIPKTAKVKSYPVVERYKWLWIWMGDPALADPAKIVDTTGSTIPTGAQARLSLRPMQLAAVNDDLLYLPSCLRARTTIGNMALVEHASVKVDAHPERHAGDALDIDQPAPPAFVRIGGSPATSIAGRSSTTPRRRSSGSTSAPRRPVPARRRAASAASRCATSMP